MTTEYPAHLLNREPAPPYDGEGEFELWHYSEDPELSRFEPRTVPTNPEEPPAVWAVDTRHAPMFWFPRDCPRGCIWQVSTTSKKDEECFFGQTRSKRIHVVEGVWLPKIQNCKIYAYKLPKDAFKPHKVGGYWTASQTVEATERIKIDDLLNRHAEAGIELRITPTIWPFWNQVINSTVEFSGSRLRNAAPGPPNAN